MTDEEIFAAVRDAIIWAKVDVVTVAPSQVTMESRLAEPPIFLDSLESIAMVTQLEERLGLVAEDEHFFSGSVQTVGDVVSAVRTWMVTAGATRK